MISVFKLLTNSQKKVLLNLFIKIPLTQKYSSFIVKITTIFQ